MLTNIGRLGLKVAYSLMVGGLAISLGGGFARAEDPSSATIIKSLTPKPLTRSLSGATQGTTVNAQDEKFIDSMRHRTTRSLSVGEREKIATIAKDKPSIDLEINFEYDSARIGPAASKTVNELGKALTDASLKGNTFILGGYADGRGRAAYNQELSERRADAVKRYLIDKFDIPAKDLVTAGYGSTHFKNANDPNAAENRRVAVTNMADSKVADK
jgi:outer membrane protein OmpA-like peptidoglycan-associated protein